MTEDTYMPRGFLRPRPIRVAYLVEDGEHADVMLDAIFAECHTRWGGRYSLVVPCEGGAPLPSYMPWLEAYDPDIIYAYNEFDEAAISSLHELLGPAFLLKHEPHDDRERDRRYFRPELPLECLTSLSVAPQYARLSPPSAPQPMFVVDYLPGQPGDRFVDDNFGTPYRCFGWWPIPDQLADALRAIYLASEELLREPHRGRRPDGETVPDTASLLRAMADKRNSFGLAQLAADSAPRIEIRERFSESFSLIIGDRFGDRVLFWNDRSRIPAYLGRDFTTIIVSPSRLENEEFFTALVTFLKARNGVHRSGGTPWIELKSASVSAGDLAALRDRFNAADAWDTYHVEDPVTLDEVVPSAKALKKAVGLVTGRIYDRSMTWREFSAEGTSAKPPAARPAHIQGLQGPSRATVGAWALDLDIERQNNLTRFSNVRHKWRLPRRLRMHGAFQKPYDGPAGSHYRFPRSSREGSLVLFTEFEEDPPTITLPDDDAAFHEALELGRNWPPASREDREVAPSGAYGWSRPSDKGRYLIGALQLFGGIQGAGSVLLHRYWKRVFDELGGAIGAARHDDIKRTLKKRLPEGAIDGEDDWDRLTRLVAHEADQVRMPLRTLNFDDLRKRHEPFVENERKILEEHKTKNPDEWIAHAQASLPQSVKWLCARSVLYQGYEWRCHTCYHLNWNQVGALHPQTNCEVCNTNQIAPVDKPWDFRLNGFLREALKEHGLLALVWCLIQLERRVRDTFFFLGPHDLFVEYPDSDRAPGDNEADLICVVDSKVHLCEVKSSGRDIRIPPLVNVAKRIRPDVVTLAVMEVGSPRLTTRFNNLKKALAGTDIAAELITLSDDAFDDGVHLPS